MSQREVNEVVAEILIRLQAEQALRIDYSDLIAAFPLAKPDREPVSTFDPEGLGYIDSPAPPGSWDDYPGTTGHSPEPEPPGDGIDERVYEAGKLAWTGEFYTDEACTDAITAAVNEYERLRGGRACGKSEPCGSSSGSPAASSPRSSAPESEPGPDAAATWAMLTEDELQSLFRCSDAFVTGKGSDILELMESVAAAQHAKSQAVVSAEEVHKQFGNPMTVFTEHGAIGWLRSIGVRVEESQ